MVGDLEYQAPERLREALDATVGAASGLRVLELGCGTGLFGIQVRSRAASLTGIDLSPEMVERARARGIYDALEVAEITEFLNRNSDPNFDLIVACDTLIYFGDLTLALAPAAKRLKPGGYVAFTVEQDETGSYKLTDSGRYAHSSAHIRSAAEAAGLKPLQISSGLLRYEYGQEVKGLITVLQRQ